jgi:hypothetical protein
MDYSILFEGFPYLPEKNLDIFFFCNNPTEYHKRFRASRQMRKLSLFSAFSDAQLLPDAARVARH